MPLWGFLFSWAVILSAPVILALLIGGRRINRRAGCISLALSFAAATVYWLWRIEWSDGWRYGTPPVSYLFMYVCYAAAYGAMGWFLAKGILRVRART